MVMRFGDFQLDFGNYELRRAGQSLKLRRQQMELLMLLTERAGLLVTFAPLESSRNPSNSFESGLGF